MLYHAEFGAGDQICIAIEVGQAVVKALIESADTGANISMTLHVAGMTPEHLHAAAEAAMLGAKKDEPSIYPSMDAIEAIAKLRNYTPHPGRKVAAILHQLARDMEADRHASTGVEWDPAHRVKLEDGTLSLHSVIRFHRIAQTPRVSLDTALMLLDADADLEINRRPFGSTLRGLTISAARQAHVTQIYDASLANSTLAPGASLPNNHLKAKKLRSRIAAFVAAKAENKRVLVLTTLTVRRAFTDEDDGPVPASVKWQGADLTHYGRHLGVNGFRDHDVVILIGREQLPPLVAERTARAIYADDLGVSLDLPGSYERELRRHDLRGGLAPPVKVQAHPDPRVQRVLELSRENALGQGLDRLRLIHRAATNAAEVIVLTNLPIPGLVVDELLSLHNVLAGGSVWDRALGRCGGVLPLSAKWLSARLGDLFTSLRTAERGVASLKPPLGNKYFYCQVAVYRTAGQRRHSKALIHCDVIDPQAALVHLIGKELLEFRWYNGQDPFLAPTVVPVAKSKAGRKRAHSKGSSAPPAKPSAIKAQPVRRAPKASSIMARALERAGGVLPLSATWLAQHQPNVFGSRASATRKLAAAKVSPNYGIPKGRIAVYSLLGQFRPSKALMRPDVANPRAMLERLLDAKLKAFRVKR